MESPDVLSSAPDPAPAAPAPSTAPALEAAQPPAVADADATGPSTDYGAPASARPCGHTAAPDVCKELSLPPGGQAVAESAAAAAATASTHAAAAAAALSSSTSAAGAAAAVAAAAAAAAGPTAFGPCTLSGGATVGPGGTGGTPQAGAANEEEDVGVAPLYRCTNPACGRLACSPCVLSCGCLVGLAACWGYVGVRASPTRRTTQAGQGGLEGPRGSAGGRRQRKGHLRRRPRWSKQPMRSSVCAVPAERPALGSPP
jgi:hypothetical protein